MKLFSKRNEPVKDVLRYDLPERVRQRILHILRSRLDDDQWSMTPIQGYGYEYTLDQVGRNLLTRYGALKSPSDARSPAEAAIHHFIACGTEEALDFIEAIFRVQPVLHVKDCVDPFNEVFQEEGIGFELTPLRENDDGPGQIMGRPAGRRIKYDFPRIIRKDAEFLHSEVIRPCLEALGRPGFETSLAEMMTAHEAYRNKQYADAITDACSAFESVMRTICTRKKWTFNPDKDTCGSLAKILAANGLFYSFYTPLFEVVGTIRNKMSDAHGRGPSPQHKADKEYADHMIQFTSANITMLIKKSGL
jgi:hypothetical protein